MISYWGVNHGEDVSKSYLGTGMWKPASALSQAERTGRKAALQARAMNRAGTRDSRKAPYRGRTLEAFERSQTRGQNTRTRTAMGLLPDPHRGMPQYKGRRDRGSNTNPYRSEFLP